MYLLLERIRPWNRVERLKIGKFPNLDDSRRQRWASGRKRACRLRLDVDHQLVVMGVDLSVSEPESLSIGMEEVTFDENKDTDSAVTAPFTIPTSNIFATLYTESVPSTTSLRWSRLSKSKMYRKLQLATASNICADLGTVRATHELVPDPNTLVGDTALTCRLCSHYQTCSLVIRIILILRIRGRIVVPRIPR